MKKIMPLLLCALLLFASAHAETAKITAEDVKNASNIMTLMEQYGAVAVDYVNEGFTERRVYTRDGESLIASDTYALTETNEVASTCLVGDDLAYYYLDPMGVTRNMMTEENVAEYFAGSLVDLTEKKFTVAEEEEAYALSITLEQGGAQLLLDKATLRPVEMQQTLYAGTDEEFSIIVTYSYGEEIEADMIAAEAYAEQANKLAEGLIFDTQDIDGNPVTLADFADAKVIMVNLWEPWCRPCVGEMPDLAKLYEKYKDKGLVLLGAFTEKSMTEEARAIAQDCGVTYPIVFADGVLNSQQTGYVPTSFFMDATGKLLMKDPVVSSRSFEEWEQIVLPLLGE